jgi:hypothetical protein
MNLTYPGVSDLESNKITGVPLMKIRNQNSLRTVSRTGIERLAIGLALSSK